MYLFACFLKKKPLFYIFSTRKIGQTCPTLEPTLVPGARHGARIHCLFVCIHYSYVSPVADNEEPPGSPRGFKGEDS